MDLLPSLAPGAMIAVLGPHAARDPMSALITELALRGEVSVLDSGNRFAPYQIASLIRRRTVQAEQAARRILIRRAFTCYQVDAMLADTCSVAGRPYLVLDLLATFQDEQVRIEEALRLLDRCLKRLEQISFTSPVAISLNPSLQPERAILWNRVFGRVSQVFCLQPEERIEQPRLFD